MMCAWCATVINEGQEEKMMAITKIPKCDPMPAVPEGKVARAFEIHSLRRQVAKFACIRDTLIAAASGKIAGH
jgi:hypothetical protein